MLDTLTKEDFEPRKGERFVLAASDTLRLDVTLTEVEGTGHRGRTREHFSLMFLGPPDPILAQRIYRIEHPQMGVLDLFLVPIGRDDRGTKYQAVFA